ncbi:hypothetical protein DJICPGNB_17930 [Escherichia coli]|nr:hypothetical protein DJICPGNB_17930 [Escherichia coli]
MQVDPPALKFRIWPCCPPRSPGVVTSIGHYLYTPREDALYINIYAGNSMEVPVENGTLRLRVSGNYPWQEQVTIAEPSAGKRHTLAFLTSAGLAAMFSDHIEWGRGRAGYS